MAVCLAGPSILARPLAGIAAHEPRTVAPGPPFRPSLEEMQDSHGLTHRRGSPAPSTSGKGASTLLCCDVRSHQRVHFTAWAELSIAGTPSPKPSVSTIHAPPPSPSATQSSRAPCMRAGCGSTGIMPLSQLGAGHQKHQQAVRACSHCPTASAAHPCACCTPCPRLARDGAN